MFDAVDRGIVRDECDRLVERRDSLGRDALAATERRRADGRGPGPDARARARPSTTSTPPAASVRRGARSSRDAEDGRGDQERDHCGDAVVARVRHRAKVGEPVREQLRERDEREPRREQEQEEQAAARARRGTTTSWPSKSAPSTAPGSVNSILDDALRRAADVVVEAEEDAVAVGERGHDDVDGDERPGEARRGR